MTAGKRRNGSPENRRTSDGQLTPTGTGDVEAVYREHYDALLRAAQSVCRNRDASEDACHEVFARIVSSPRSTEQIRLPYLVVSVRNACRDQRRREKKWRPLGPGTPEAVISSSPDDGEGPWAHLLARWISHLPRMQRTVVTLRAEGYSCQEIATSLELTIKTVKTHLARARATLRMLASEERERERERESRVWGGGSRECITHSPAA